MGKNGVSKNLNAYSFGRSVEKPLRLYQIAMRLNVNSHVCNAWFTNKQSKTTANVVE